MREDTTQGVGAAGTPPPRHRVPSGHRLLSVLGVLGLVLFVTVASLVVPAGAAGTTISFEEFEDGTELTTQTEARGIRFEVQEGAETGAIVTTCDNENPACTVAQTGQNAIATPIKSVDTTDTRVAPVEESVTGYRLAAVFTEPQREVRLAVQEWDHFEQSQIAILTARNENNEIVAASQIRFDAGTGWHQIAVSTPSPTIERITLTLAGEENPDTPHNLMAVDDLTFVSNQPPTAAFDIEPADPIAEDPVFFDAAGSGDSDGEIVEYRWDFSGNGEFDTVREQPSVAAAFQEPGTYEVTLEVVDNAGATDRVTREVTVLSPPAAQCRVSDTRIAAGESVFIDASGSEAQWVRFDVDGDGNYDRTVSDIFRVATSYDTADTYQPVVRAEVGDQADRAVCSEITVYTTVLGGIPADVAFGGLGGVVGLMILRKAHRRLDGPDNRTPNAAIEIVPDNPAPGRPVLFDGTGSTDPDPDDRVVGYQWSIGDREVIGPRVVHTFLQEGDYDITLRVVDTHAAADTTSTDVTVEATDGELVLEDIHPDAPGDDHENLEEEYLVFWNDGDDNLTLGDWTVHDTAEAAGQVTPGAHTFTFPAEFTLGPDETVVVHTGTAPEDDAAADDTAEGRHLYWEQPRAIWNNDADRIVVEDDSGHPALAVRYTRTNGGTYETEDLDVKVLDEWFGSVVVSGRKDRPIVSIIPGAGVGIAVAMWLVTNAWGATLLAGPKRFLYSWANITGYLGSSTVAWTAVTESGVLLPSLEPIGPVLLVALSVVMMLIGGVGVSLQKTLSVLLGWIG